MGNLQASWIKYTLQFKRPSGTSRGILTEKKTWFLFISQAEQPDIVGIGECGPLKGLSPDDSENFEAKLNEVCIHIEEYRENYQKSLTAFPAIQFGLESALLDFQAKGMKILFPSLFTAGKTGIRINGLIWMGSREYMYTQIREKLANGFSCLKLKIGAIYFEQELSLLKSIRREYSSDEVEIRVDANGAFTPQEALEKLKRLSELEIHSIEQPIQAGQTELMANLCKATPLPIALDEELIGVTTSKAELLDTIKPQYIILKPTLVGGFRNAEKWCSLANERHIPWWITSALESNIGLNAIAQWTATLNNSLPQGLGTGQLYTNNIPSPLFIKNGYLYYEHNYKDCLLMKG